MSYKVNLIHRHIIVNTLLSDLRFAWLLREVNRYRHPSYVMHRHTRTNCARIAMHALSAVS